VFEQSGRAAINPNWSPDGVRIVFAMTGPRELQQGAEPTADDVYTIAADGTDLRPLTCDAPKDWSPLWARDGAIYFVSRRDGGENIWSMPAPAAGNP
jgi:Tol biopolymer transport system component